MNNDVLIKWIGSKRLQGPHILQHFPSQIETYYEPFLGGGSMLYALMTSPIKVGRLVGSGLNPDLIAVWKLVQSDPVKILAAYEQMWDSLAHGGKDFYYRIRHEFNEDRDPCKFFFLLRTCRNGLVRYNRHKEFNASFHLKRQGIQPARLRPIVERWHRLLSERCVEFHCGAYGTVRPAPGDFVYLDPPYATPRDFPIYYGMIDYEELWNWMRGLPCAYALSLNGFKGERDCTLSVPPDLYQQHLLVPNGLSKMDQLVEAKIPAWDSLYIRKLLDFGPSTW